MGDFRVFDDEAMDFQITSSGQQHWSRLSA
jgi:hypothetical protein